jgi:predicted porin
MMLTLSGTVYAEKKGNAKLDTDVEIGIKSFYDTYKTDNSTGGGGGATDGVLVGPAVDAKFSNNFIVEASYLVTASDYVSSDSTPAEHVKNTDIDLAAGYMVKPGLGMLAGYKSAELKFRADGSSVDLLKRTNSGAYVGILGTTAATKETSFYGKLDYLLTRSKTDAAGVSVSEDNPGWLVEVGIKDYGYDNKVAASFGYRYETTKGKTSKFTETFSGVTLSVMYVF